MPVTIFFCYAHEDELLLNKLKAQLKPLQRRNVIDVWYDRNISAGTEWEHDIDQHLNSAQIILLLVSPDFMNSDYCYGIEMKRALERHARKEAVVIPIILRHVYWQEEFGNLQVLPTDAKPVIDRYWHSIDEAHSLHHHYIGTEHLLLGLVREGEGIAAGVLETFGINLEKVRKQTLQVLSQRYS